MNLSRLLNRRTLASALLAGVCLAFLLSNEAGAETPISRDGLLLWLHADAGVQSKDGTITGWQDSSAAGNHAERDGAFPPRAHSPILIPGAVNGHSLLRFDGSDAAFHFPRLTNIVTVFWVVAKDAKSFGQNNERFVLGDSTGKDFHVGTHKTAFLLHPSESSAALRQGTVRVNGRVIDPLKTDFPNRLSVISMVATGSVPADQISKDRQFKDRSWQGDIAEVILYSRALPDAEREQIEKQLLAKYDIASAPPVAANHFLPRATLNQSTTWLGNTFSGGGRNTKWVQNFMFTSAVNAGGRVFTASHWDEAHRESGIYENGDVIGNCAGAIGEAVAVNGTHVFVGAKNGIKQFTFDGKPTGKVFALPNMPRYLSANASEIYVSDAVENRVIVLNIESSAQTAGWSVSQPGALAATAAGEVWVVENIQRQAWDGRYWMIDEAKPAKILHYSRSGEKLPGEIAGDKPDWKPTALAFDPQGRLMIGDDGPRHQVLFFDVTVAPKLVSAFGAHGGLGSGTPGVAEPDKFWGITGVGADRDGNIFVTLNEQGCVLRKFTPAGKLAWELANHIFVDVADFDPASDGEHIYAKQEHFVFDYTKPPGQGWRLHAHTLDATKYPQDPRLWMANDGHSLMSPFMRRLNNGKLYMFIGGMNSETLAIYRFVGEIAVPAGLVAKSHYSSKGAPNYPPHQPGNGEWLWRDSNGDGAFQADEFSQPANPQTHSERWNWFVDARGDIWTDVKEGLRKFPLQGFDAHGNPIYDFASAQVIASPAPFDRVSRMEYDATTDTLFLSGYTPEHPHDGKFWKEGGRVLARYNEWSTGNRTPKWTSLWHWAEGGPETYATPHCFAVVGDFIHVGYFHRGGPVVNRIYNAHTGELVGEMRPGPEVNGVIGDIDAVSAIRAMQRKNGEQIILQEDDRYGKVVMFRWRPGKEGAGQPRPR